MITTIGLAAGAILNLLEDKRKALTMEEIKSCLDSPSEIITMALGWLIRENYLSFDSNTHKYFTVTPQNPYVQNVIKKMFEVSK